MRFRTEITPPAAPFRLGFGDSLLLVGSCFSDNIGSRLMQHGCRAAVNLCGVQYNPESIAAIFRAALFPESVPDTMFEYDGRFRSWLLPQIFSAGTSAEAHDIFHSTIGTLRQSIADCAAIILTFGTAQVWRHIPSEISAFSGTVGNCHKVPAKEFTHTMLSPDEIVEEWRLLVQQLRKVNPDVKLIYTVSPVRHLNPSPRLNTLSKAVLHIAVQRLVEADTDADSQLSAYFPAYELLMDDLRDYRFYAADMTHPSEQAADYIFGKFAETYYTAADCEKMRAAFAATRRATHRRLLS